MDQNNQRKLLCLYYFPILLYKNMQLMQRRQLQLKHKIFKRRIQLIERMYTHMQSTNMATFLSFFNSSHIHMNQFFINAVKQKRRFWMKTRRRDFWERIVEKQFTDNDFIETFRMQRNSFNKLCKKLSAYIKPKANSLKAREPLSVEKQLAVTLYKLASYVEYDVVGNVFGIHKSTVKKCIYRVVNAINDSMLDSYIYMPNDMEAAEISLQFEKISKIPQIIGCLGASHIPIVPPSYGFRDYVNGKGWPSYSMQAVIDDKCRFRDIFIKYPRNSDDATVFKTSSLYKNVETIIPQSRRPINGSYIPFMIVGNPAYPLLPWLMKSYSGDVTAEQESFNVHLNSARVVVEMAFGRLKGRWKILQKRMDIHYTFASEIISACCVLHNFVEDCKDPFMQRWLEEVEAAEHELPQPGQLIYQGTDDLTATQIRSHISDNLITNFPLRNT